MARARPPRRSKPTFADLVKEPTWSESQRTRTGRFAVRPGGVNGAGEFFDPSGLQLWLQAEETTVDEAQRLVDTGALVIAEGCGCGGWYAGCTPRWVTDEQLRALRGAPSPTLLGRGGTPTWIDVWSNERGTVVFAHGDVSWGQALG